MLSKKGKIIFIVVSIMCIMGTLVAVYIGFFFFRDRQRIFWIFTSYIVLIACIVVFMVHRYIKTYIS